MSGEIYKRRLFTSGSMRLDTERTGTSLSVATAEHVSRSAHLQHGISHTHTHPRRHPNRIHLLHICNWPRQNQEQASSGGRLELLTDSEDVDSKLFNDVKHRIFFFLNEGDVAVSMFALCKNNQ